MLFVLRVFVSDAFLYVCGLRDVALLLYVGLICSLWYVNAVVGAVLSVFVLCVWFARCCCAGALLVYA